jgi:hypothetical protein
MVRGRKPRPITIRPGDMVVLRQIAQGRNWPAYQAQRAQILLAIAEGQRSWRVAQAAACNTATVWRICRRYEQTGLSGLLADGRRSA